MIEKLDNNYWNKRYIDQETGWDIGGVSTPLKEYFDTLNNQSLSILIPGAGNAYEAEYLMNKGLENVFVCDISEEAINNFKKRCPNFKNENLILGDFFGLSGLQFDIIVEQTFFCALDPSLRKKYFEKMRSLLRPEGRLVGLLFDDALNNDKPPFGGTKSEYLDLIGDSFDSVKLSACYNSIEPRKGRELFMNLQKRG